MRSNRKKNWLTSGSPSRSRAAFAAPAAQASLSEQAWPGVNPSYYAAVTASASQLGWPGVNPSNDSAKSVAAVDYGMPRAMPHDYTLASGDQIEVVRAEPRGAFERPDRIRPLEASLVRRAARRGRQLQLGRRRNRCRPRTRSHPPGRRSRPGHPPDRSRVDRPSRTQRCANVSGPRAHLRLRRLVMPIRRARRPRRPLARHSLDSRGDSS